jgi:hypothetical protein
MTKGVYFKIQKWGRLLTGQGNRGVKSGTVTMPPPPERLSLAQSLATPGLMKSALMKIQ